MKYFKRILFFIIIATFLFSGCGKKNTQNPPSTSDTVEEAEVVELIEEEDEAKASDENSEEETSSTDPEASKEVIEPVLPEEIPFMEEKGILFDITPETSFKLHTSISKDKEVPEEQDFETVLTGVRAFKASENYTEVEGYHYKQGTFLIYKNEDNKGVNFSAYLCDYYTGELIQFEGGKDVSPDMTKAMADKAFIVKVGEVEYSITAFSDFQMVDYGWELTFTALVPDEYDGLCFAIGGIEVKADNEAEDTSTETKEEQIFITDTSYGEKPELWHFYRAQIEPDSSDESEGTEIDGANAGSGDIEIPGDIVEGTALTQEEIDELLGE